MMFRQFGVAIYLLTSAVGISCPAVAQTGSDAASALKADSSRILVRNQGEYELAAERVRPGDTIVLADGTWRDFEIVLTGQGTAAQPITLTAATPGKVILSGRSNLRIGGRHIVVSGLTFRDGYSPTSEVISFRRSKQELATDSRVTETVIVDFNKPDRYESDYWVGIYGQRNRFDHNHLEGKRNQGVTLAVRLDQEGSRENGHRIDHNFFGPRPVLGSNGGETLRIGTSQYSMFTSGTIVENNWFEHCDGEVEIISSKSGGNVFRGNVFFESRGALTLRHGDGNVVERNIFLGGGKDHTGGIRVINRNQVVRDNYMEGLRGDGFGSALAIMNGVPNSPVNRYVQVTNAVIERNSILDSSRVTLAAGADEERSAAPRDSSFASNLLVAAGAGKMIDIKGDISGLAFSGNILDGEPAGHDIAGIDRRKVDLRRADNGLLYPVDAALAAIGAPRDLKPVRREDTGAPWYGKVSSGAGFDTGARQQVMPGEDSLTMAVNASSPGGTLALSAGDYVVNQTLAVSHALSITGPADATAILHFRRPTLFQLSDGGSLSLSDLSISGDEAPDAVGNAVIRSEAVPLLKNSNIRLVRVDVRDLDVNKAFSVVKLDKNAFADRVTIADSRFANISGSVLSAVSETDDYGRYNAEYVDISGSKFVDIGGPVVAIYRGGTDESSFGPHVTITGIDVAGSGKIGAGGAPAVIMLHGVQRADISGSRFVDSAPIHVIHTVGKPETVISKNEFAGTSAPVIEELIWNGPARARLSENRGL